MRLTSSDIARMIDLSCVRTISTKADIDEMVSAAKEYGFGQVSVLQSLIPYTQQLLSGNSQIHVVGNVSFPSGSDSTSMKVCQAKEMAEARCDEIDVVMNIGLLKSGEVVEVEKDICAVINAVSPIPVKVIIEIMVLSQKETRLACDICLRSGASFVKTGTGWADRGTTVEDVQLIKSVVGDKLKIKASGGIRDLNGLLALYAAGARRFGINLKSGIEIVRNCAELGGVELV